MCCRSPSPLVSISATCSVVRMYLSSTSFFFTFSLSQWYLISKCLVRSARHGFVALHVSLLQLYRRREERASVNISAGERSAGAKACGSPHFPGIQRTGPAARPPGDRASPWGRPRHEAAAAGRLLRGYLTAVCVRNTEWRPSSQLAHCPFRCARLLACKPRWVRAPPRGT